jgi:hypothetical protein
MLSCEPRWQAAAACWESRQRRERAAAASGTEGVAGKKWLCISFSEAAYFVKSKMFLMVPLAHPFVWLLLLSPFSSEVGHPSLRAHLVTTLLSAQRERRQGRAPSLRRLSEQPRQCPRSPLLAPPTRLHHWAHTLALAWEVNGHGHPAWTLPDLGFVVPVAITPQGRQDPRQPPRQRHHGDPLPPAGRDAFGPAPAFLTHRPLAAPDAPRGAHSQRPSPPPPLLGDRATLLLLSCAPLPGHEAQRTLDLMGMVEALSVIKGGDT